MKRPRFGVAMKTVRRIHMYVGLFMYPWVLLYGLSGLLFNHPQIGRDLAPRSLSGARLQELTGFTPWQPEAIAEDIVSALNTRGGARYRLEPGAELIGFPILAGPAPDGGRNVLILSLTSGRAGIAHHPKPPAHASAPFAGPVEVPRYTMAALEGQLGALLGALGIEGAKLRAHPKVAPELRFRVHDGTRTWNVVYDLRTGELAGRPSDGPSHVALVELLGKLHTQHHFPVHWGVSGYHALFADLTALSLLLWAVSGLVMWWQIRPSRRWGAVAIALSFGLAAATITGMSAELTFLPQGEASGP